MMIMNFRFIFSTVVILCSLSSLSSGQVLQVPEVIQEQTEWCWAATSTCILQYYGNEVTQCMIADYARTHATWHDFGTVNCCENPKSKCNYWNYNFGYSGSIQDILKQWDVESYGSGGFLTPDKIKRELGEGRPFVIRFALVPSGGHFVVGHGIADSTIYYMNPWPGEGYKIASYNWVLSNSKQSWQGTNIITTNPVRETIELLSPKDSSVNQSHTPILTWRSSKDGLYRIQCAKNKTFTNPLVDTLILKDTSLQLHGLAPSTMYYWNVCKADTSGATGGCSSIWRFTSESATSVLNNRKTSPGIVARFTRGELLLSYTVTNSSVVSVSIHSLQGKLYRTVLRKFHQKGLYTTQCESVNLPPGNYLLSICEGGNRKTALLPFTY